MKTPLLFFFLLFVSSATYAQNDKNVQRLEQSVEELRKLLINPEKEDLEKITSASLTYGHSNGRIENQQEFIDFILSGKSQFVTIQLEDQTVDVVGKTGIVRHILLADTNDEGTLGSIKLGVMLIWHKKGKNWELLARQAFKL